MIILLVICAWAFWYWKRKKKHSIELEVEEYYEEMPIVESSSFVLTKPVRRLPDVDVSMYQKRYRLMTNSESSFFHLAQKSLPEGYHIFPKMRIADIIETKNGNGYYKQRNKILPKHVDFVICDKNLRTVCAIEIDGKSHDTQKMRERDELVEYIFKYVGIPLKRVRVGEDFHVVCDKMKQYLTTSSSN